ncbi:MAG: cytochrome P450 [Polyangiaceae bacterium]|nr:cytochrome P450 [Polyangiaceae bacterium]
MHAKAAPPRVEGLPLVGTLPHLLRDPLGFTVAAARRGDVVDLGVPLGPIYLVSRPDLVEEVLVRDHRSYIKDRTTRDLSEILGGGLVTSEGEAWRRNRKLAQPAFHRERIASYGETMIRLAEEAIGGWAPGQQRDVHADMMRLTRAIVARTLFDVDVAADARELDAALEVVIQRFAGVPPGLPLVRRIPTPGKRRFDRARARLDALIHGIIADRRARGGARGDLLATLMSAVDDEGRGMSDRQLRDEIMTLFLAGHETTASALTWTFVLLSRHPAVREELSRELHEVLGGRAPDVADLPRLRFTERVVVESMRLFPPVWAIGREAIEPASIGPFPVRPGAQVWISQYVIHRDPRWFDDPGAFRPERWEGDLARRLPRYAYFPFGGGPRVCIGNAFAMMEAVLLLATIARRFRLELVPGHPVEAAAQVTLRPKRGARVTVARP